jgi:hypothetical protein
MAILPFSLRHREIFHPKKGSKWRMRLMRRRLTNQWKRRLLNLISRRRKSLKKISRLFHENSNW